MELRPRWSYGRSRKESAQTGMLASQSTAFVPLDMVSVHAFTAANSMPPCGVDLLVVSANCVIGLPRSVAVGVA